jgi:hypothetical protein
MTENILVESSGHECDVLIDAWLKDLLVHTPGANRKIVKREFLLTAREFYEQSTAWRVVVGPRDMKANKRRYILSPYDAYANIVQVLDVECEGFSLRRLPRRPAGKEVAATRPTHYYLEDSDYVRLWPTPTETVEDALTFHVALTPKITVRHLPRVSFAQHYDALLDGVLGRLYAHPAKPYTNPTLAQYRLRRFRNAIGVYAAKAKLGGSNAPAWQFPKFGR